MRLGRLNHVGIACPSVEAAAAHWGALLGADKVGDAFDLPAQGVRVCFVDAPNGQIELIAPLGEVSPIARFLERNPAGGQHHLCFEVDDLEAAIVELRANGATILGEPRIGAHGAPVVFLHPKEHGGVLVELMESPSSGAGH